MLCRIHYSCSYVNIQFLRLCRDIHICIISMNSLCTLDLVIVVVVLVCNYDFGLNKNIIAIPGNNKPSRLVRSSFVCLHFGDGFD